MTTVLAALAVALSALGTPILAHAQPTTRHAHAPLTWSRTTQHLSWPNAGHVVRTVRHVYPIWHPKGKSDGTWTKAVQRSPHVRVVTVYPRYARPAPAQPEGSYTALMEVTYYEATGSPMANGIYPSVGWAACGDDLALGERVFVPGVGLLTCGDRIGRSGNPWRHVDVFGYRRGLGNDYREVIVYD